MIGFYMICGGVMAFAAFIGFADFLERRARRKQHGMK